MTREHRTGGPWPRDTYSARSSARAAAGPDPSTSICTWEVLPSDSSLPIVASGISTDADKARRDVEAAMNERGAGFAHLVRSAIPGMSPDIRERTLWPPLGEIQQCRRNRNGGFSWRPLYPAASASASAASEAATATATATERAAS